MVRIEHITRRCLGPVIINGREQYEEPYFAHYVGLASKRPVIDCRERGGGGYKIGMPSLPQNIFRMDKLVCPFPFVSSWIVPSLFVLSPPSPELMTGP